MSIDADGHFKRIAAQIYTQLPEDKRDALLVLRYVRQIVFCLGEDWETVSPSSLLPFSAAERGRAKSRATLRAVQNDRPGTANPE